MQVPLLDLKAQYATIREEMQAAVLAVMESQQFIGGPAVKELEGLVAAYSGCRAAVGVSSGTDALLASLMALGIGTGDEVITTPYTFFATAGSIWRTGAKPVFVDIEPDTFNIDPSRIEAAVTDRTRAIIPVHLFGQVAEMDPIMSIAERHGLHVIEDAAQAIGAQYRGRRAGSIGTVGCFSFFPSKNLGGLGDGGMVVTQDPALGERLAITRNHGSKPKYYHGFVGGNFRLDTIQAAGLIVKLRHLDGWSARRRENAARYDTLLAGCPQVVTPTVRPHNVSVVNQYVIRVPRRNELQAYLKEQGIGTEVYYPLSLHQQECFASLGHRAGDFPESERAAAESLALPIYPELTEEQLTYVAGRIGEFCAGG
jgi:dTDP-4-amino-4,6-dideoxygalactose transaminase